MESHALNSMAFLFSFLKYVAGKAAGTCIESEIHATRGYECHAIADTSMRSDYLLNGVNTSTRQEYSQSQMA